MRQPTSGVLAALNTARRLAAIVIALTLAPPAGARPITISKALGSVRATFRSEKVDPVEYHHLRLQIIRAGVRVRSENLDPVCKAAVKHAPAGGFCRPQATMGDPLTVRDLDGDGEPEVVVDLNTGGAHCCFFSRIYRYRRATRRYVVLTHFWGNFGYRLANLDRRGPPELLARDDRFAYVFTSFAGSRMPPRIYAYRHGRLIVVTRRHPAVIRRDLRTLRRDFRQAVRRRGEVFGILAALVADEYLLGHYKGGRQALHDAYRRGYLNHSSADTPKWPTGRAYIRKLERFLRRTGYRR